jgi:predicted CopG family antitoxin
MAMAKKIKIDDELYEKLARCAATAGYSSAEEFILHLLQKIAGGTGKMDDEEKIKEQLKGLGYLS